MVKDHGGNDSEASHFKYSKPGSEIVIPQISTDDDGAEKMRHLEIEKERKAREEALRKQLEEEKARKKAEWLQRESEEAEAMALEKIMRDRLIPKPRKKKVAEMIV